jgi:hypothetical protein
LDVETVDFQRTLEPKRDGWLLAYGAIVPAIPVLVIVVGLLIGFRTVMPVVAQSVTRLTEQAATSRTSRVVAGYAPAQVRGALAHEPPHAAAAVISALPAATAAAVLELYPQHEREAIIARMQRIHSTVIPGADEILARHA